MTLSNFRSTASHLEIHDFTLALPGDSTLKQGGSAGNQTIVIPTLTFLSGNAIGKELPLIKPQVTLGRGEESDLLVQDPSVSRKHVRLTCRRLVGRSGNQSLKIVLEDLGSKNGTMVNYRKTTKAVLKPGDKICLGRVILKFELKDLADQQFYNEIYRMATTDNLTSLLNKASITRILSEEMVKRIRYRGRCSILLFDIDDFKRLNDRYGHLVGDRALQSVGGIIHRSLRKQDRAGRFGGEEFLAILPETGLKGAMAVAERIRRDIEEGTRPEIGVEDAVTVSAGVATYPGGPVEELLENADRALYRAKARGKNRVEVWRNRKTAPGNKKA
jgi:diguanylate cyclase (GGDEF)-like protein